VISEEFNKFQEAKINALNNGFSSLSTEEMARVAGLPHENYFPTNRCPPAKAGIYKLFKNSII
jgi:hypothetical protein